MKTEITKDQAIGKTIENIEFSWNGQMAITFTDDTFTAFGIDFGYEHGDGEIEPRNLSIDSFGDEKLELLGIITVKELNAKRQKEKEERQKMWLAKAEAEEFQRYQLLKTKYEGVK